MFSPLLVCLFIILEEFMHVTFDEFTPSYRKKVVVNDDADKKLQKKESLNDKKDNALCKNQEERQEEQTNIEKNEGNSYTRPEV